MRGEQQGLLKDERQGLLKELTAEILMYRA